MTTSHKSLLTRVSPRSAPHQPEFERFNPEPRATSAHDERPASGGLGRTLPRYDGQGSGGGVGEGLAYRYALPAGHVNQVPVAFRVGAVGRGAEHGPAGADVEPELDVRGEAGQGAQVA